MSPDDEIKMMLEKVHAKEHDSAVDTSVYNGPDWRMTDRFKQYAIFRSITGLMWHFVNLDTGQLYGGWKHHQGARREMRSVVLAETGVDFAEAPKPKRQRSYAQMVRDLGSHIPGFYDTVWCPGCSNKDTVFALVVHINDEHRWSREKIADWLEEIDADTTIHQDAVAYTRIDWTEGGEPPSRAPVVGGIVKDADAVVWAYDHGTIKQESIDALIAKMQVPQSHIVHSATKVEFTMTPEVAEFIQALEPVKEAWSEIKTAMQQLAAEFNKIGTLALAATASATTKEDTEDEHQDH